MVVSVQIAICFGTDHVVSVDSVFLERKPAQWVDNSVTGLWKIFFNQNPASSENMCLKHLGLVNKWQREILENNSLLFCHSWEPDEMKKIVVP